MTRESAPSARVSHALGWAHGLQGAWQAEKEKREGTLRADEVHFFFLGGFFFCNVSSTVYIYLDSYPPLGEKSGRSMSISWAQNGVKRYQTIKGSPKNSAKPWPWNWTTSPPNAPWKSRPGIALLRTNTPFTGKETI